MDLIRII